MKNELGNTQNHKIRSHSKIVIIGAGDGGFTMYSLLKNLPDFPINQIKIIDPATRFYYQSLQTLVGTGYFPSFLTNISQKYIYQKQCNRVYANVQRVVPEQNYLICEDGTEHSYDVLVIASGFVINFDKIPGLKDALADPTVPVGSNYILEYAQKYGKFKKEFKGGLAIFTQPATPIKCGGAPQKIMYLSCAAWNRYNPFSARRKYAPEFFTGAKFYFPNSHYRPALEKVAADYNVKINLECQLVEIDGNKRTAVFQNGITKERIERSFDIMHVTPPMFPPIFIKDSGLSDPDGFVLVDIHTLQHQKFSNVFSLGDSAGLPTSRTASVLNEQSYVLQQNIQRFLQQKPLTEKYNGYTSCPVFVGNGKVMLCEFGYDGQNMSTFLDDQTVPRRAFYLMKVFALPISYMLGGPKLIRSSRHLILRTREQLKGFLSNFNSFKK